VELPKELDQIDAKWLTAALHAAGTLTQGSVKSLQAEPIAIGVGLMGRLARLTVDYEGADADAPRSIIFKYPIDLPQNRQVADAYRFYKRECDFYRHLAPQSPLRTPKVYFNQCDEDLQFVLLLEDLASARAGDQVAGNSADDAQRAIAELAKHHAHFWGKTGDYDYLIDIDDPIVCAVLEQSYGPALPATLEAYSDMFSPELAETAKGLATRTTRAMQKTRLERPLTLAHGDFRADNLFYEGLPGGGDLAVIDWQICTRSYGPFDVAYHLTQSVSPDTRRRIERPILENYHRTLVEHGIEDLSFEQLWEYYRMDALFALVYPVTVCGALDLSDPRAKALGHVFLERSLSAIADLNAGEKLSEWD